MSTKSVCEKPPSRCPCLGERSCWSEDSRRCRGRWSVVCLTQCPARLVDSNNTTYHRPLGLCVIDFNTLLFEPFRLKYSHVVAFH
ncbi:hypothetical protein LSAT2_025595 [Lamellibrachia satsuma]|nr:hypothetical protein LSAT2_025595 [Lamellibrachia satsuma]